MTDDDAVLAADDARLAALIAADFESLDRLLSDELVFVHGNGKQDGKRAFLDHARSGDIRYTAIGRDETTVRVSGDVAILCASIHVEVLMRGERLCASPVRYMGVWKKAAGAWRLLAMDNVRP